MRCGLFSEAGKNFTETLNRFRLVASLWGVSSPGRRNPTEQKNAITAPGNRTDPTAPPRSRPSVRQKSGSEQKANLLRSGCGTQSGVEEIYQASYRDYASWQATSTTGSEKKPVASCKVLRKIHRAGWADAANRQEPPGAAMLRILGSIQPNATTSRQNAIAIEGDCLSDA
jgi:hypothetical protein